MYLTEPVLGEGHSFQSGGGTRDICILVCLQGIPGLGLSGFTRDGDCEVWLVGFKPRCIGNSVPNDGGG